MSRYGRGSYGRESYYGSQWPEYVSVAEKRARALEEVKKLQKKGVKLSPVVIEGRTVARSFWGKAWCQNLEAYSDYANRLPRGKSYLSHGCVIDLQIAKGSVTAIVKGTSRYNISIAIKPLLPARWKALKSQCSGSIDSLMELLQGKLSTSVMKSVTDPSTGLFPAPSEIQMSCSCPDSAWVCKHIAAVVYGVGARLDSQPELLFTLRGVEPAELLSQLAPAPSPQGQGALGGADLGALFGIEIAPEEAPRAGRKARVKALASAPVAAPTPSPAQRPMVAPAAKRLRRAKAVVEVAREVLARPAKPDELAKPAKPVKPASPRGIAKTQGVASMAQELTQFMDMLSSLSGAVPRKKKKAK